VTCLDLAGNYNLRFFETSCNKKEYSGTLSGSVDRYCRFNFDSNYGVAVTGNLTGNNGKTYIGRCKTTPCGEASLICIDTGDGISCMYSFDKGGSGIVY
jgi:hypothetical protein